MGSDHRRWQIQAAIGGEGVERSAGAERRER